MEDAQIMEESTPIDAEPIQLMLSLTIKFPHTFSRETAEKLKLQVAGWARDLESDFKKINADVTFEVSEESKCQK